MRTALTLVSCFVTFQFGCTVLTPEFRAVMEKFRYTILCPDLGFEPIWEKFSICISMWARVMSDLFSPFSWHALVRVQCTCAERLPRPCSGVFCGRRVGFRGHRNFGRLQWPLSGVFRGRQPQILYLNFLVRLLWPYRRSLWTSVSQSTFCLLACLPACLRSL